jgi:alcohol dehydrogenase
MKRKVSDFVNRRVYRINRAGSLKRLNLTKEKLSFPDEDEVTVEVKAIGLNFADLFAIQGLYSATPKGSFIPGLEYSGIIVEKGEEVKGFQIGDKIMGAVRFGAYATHLNINHRYILKMPEEWSFEEGSSFLIQPLTAYYSLVELGNLQQNDTVLIHSAAGGVGIYANRIAKKFNTFTIGTTGSDSKKSFLLDEGYDRVIVRDKNFKGQLSDTLNGKNLNIVLECIGGKIFKDSFDLLAPSGRIIVYGGAHFMTQSSKPNYFKVITRFLSRPKVDPLSLSNTNRSVMGFNLIYLWDKPDELKNMLNNVLKMNLKPPHIGKVYSFENLIKALKFFQTGKSIGKIVVKVN